MVAPTCFGITLPSSGSVPSAFWEMLNWGAVDRILWKGVWFLVTWCAPRTTKGAISLLSAFAYKRGLFVRLSVCIKSPPTGRVFMKYDIGDVNEYLSRREMSRNLHKDVSKLVLIVGNITKYFVAQQYEGNTLLRFHDDTLNTGWSRSLFAPDDYNTEIYK
jgi:hypothetical protein